MALPGETLANGAPCICEDCGMDLTKLQVCHSAAGYYIGTWCHCGPYSRESNYYKSMIAAQEALDSGIFDR